MLFVSLAKARKQLDQFEFKKNVVVFVIVKARTLVQKKLLCRYIKNYTRVKPGRVSSYNNCYTFIHADIININIIIIIIYSLTPPTALSQPYPG